jgi:hypothetical protein
MDGPRYQMRCGGRHSNVCVKLWFAAEVDIECAEAQIPVKLPGFGCKHKATQHVTAMATAGCLWSLPDGANDGA